jgi:hypothetical protein
MIENRLVIPYKIRMYELFRKFLARNRFWLKYKSLQNLLPVIRLKNERQRWTEIKQSST